ncbi:MAG TPA: hypothetical protein VJX94_20060 [Stellaceae bacterium]|nr:hypothetical protein [Stellaceae bacterium]
MRIALISLLLLLAGCHEDLAAAIGSQDLRLAVYRPGYPIKNKTVAANSLQALELKNWAAQNDAGWTPSYIDYVPSYVVNGRKFSLNISETKAVLMLDSHQYEKEISSDSFNWLKQRVFGVTDNPLVK